MVKGYIYMGLHWVRLFGPPWKIIQKHTWHMEEASTGSWEYHISMLLSSWKKLRHVQYSSNGTPLDMICSTYHNPHFTFTAAAAASCNQKKDWLICIDQCICICQFSHLLRPKPADYKEEEQNRPITIKEDVHKMELMDAATWWWSNNKQWQL